MEKSSTVESNRQCALRNVHRVSGLMAVHSMKWLSFCSMLSQGQLVSGFGKWK